MDLMSLTATLGLDTSAFTSGLGIAKDLMVGFGNAVADFSRDVIETGMGFDRQMSAVESLLGSTEGSMENMERLRAFALDQAHDSIFTAEQTGEAYYYMGMAGWKAEQMLAGLPGIIALAASTGEDLGTVSDIVTDSLDAFKLSADDASWFVDILAQTARNSNTDVYRMGQTFQYVASTAGSVGADVDDIALAIGLMASQAVKGTKAGTALRNILSRLGTDTGNARTNLEALGVTVFDSEGKMRDFGDIIMESREAWKGLTDEEQLFYAKSIAGQYGMNGWLAMMNAADDKVELLTQSFEDANGAAQEMADTRLDNLAGDIERFGAALDVLKIAIFDDVKGPLRDVVQFGTDALDRITNAVNENGLEGGIQQLGVVITTIGQKIKPMLESLGEAIAPLLQSVFETILPSLLDSADALGAAFAEGIIKGVGENVLPDIVTGFFGGISGGANESEYFGESTFGEWAKNFFGFGSNTAEAEKYTIPLTLDDSGITDQTVPVDADTSAIPGQVEDTVNGITGLSVDVTGVVTNIVQGGGGGGSRRVLQKNARAMSGGYIFDRPTVFGFAEGKYQVAGDAGPEAVVGTRSLNTMVESAVARSMDSMLSRLDGMIDRMPAGNMRVVLDTGALVGGLVGDMDASLNDRAVWKGYGRTL